MRNKIRLSLVIVLILIVFVWAQNEQSFIQKFQKLNSELTLKSLEGGLYQYDITGDKNIKVDYKGFQKEYVNIQKFGEDSKLIFEGDGKLVTAKFKVGQGGAGEYALGNEKVYLPEGSEVDFAEGKAKITMPAGKKLKKPASIDGDLGESIFEFLSKDNKFDFDNGYVFKGESLKFEKGGWFFDYKGKAKLNSLNILNSDSDRIYINFDGKENTNFKKGAYISIDDKNGRFVTGSNINQRGPKISFAEGNPYGLKVETKNDDHFAVQSLGNEKGAYVKIINRDNQKLVPKMDTLNQFVTNFDEKSIHYHSVREKLYFSPKVLMKGFDKMGKSSIPVEIASFKNKNGLKSVSNYGNVLGIGDDVEWGYGSNPEYIRTTTYYSGFRDAVAFRKGFSNTWEYYNINSAESFKSKFGIDINNIELMGNKPTQIKENIRVLKDIMYQVPETSRNNIKEIRFVDKMKDGHIGLGHSDGLIELTGEGFEPDIVVHEIAHLREYELDFDTEGNKFFKEWESIGGQKEPYLTDHGEKHADERLSTFVEKIYESDDYWKGHLTGPHKDRVKSRIVFLQKHKFITPAAARRILGSAAK